MTPACASPEDARVRLWLEIREPLERQLSPLGHAAMAALGLKGGEHVLDIGCGVGATPRDLAMAVGATGSVVGLDLLQGAIDVARQDAALPQNISFLCGDAQSVPLAREAFDAAFSRFGVMFFADPVAAFANIRLGLKAGGRLAFVCWRDLTDNELDCLPLRAASPALTAELVAEAAAAGWFSLSERDVLKDCLSRAGFVDIGITPYDAEVSCGSLQATLDVCCRVGALGKILRDHPQFRNAASAALAAALADRDEPGGPCLRAATWVVSARMPELTG